MKNIDEIISKLQQLDIHQQELVEHLIEELGSTQSRQAQTVPNNTINTPQQRIPNRHFISSNGVYLSIGDKVRILTNTKTGKNGDTATIVKFNKKYIAIRLDRNGSNTQRAASNLEYIPSS